MEESEIAEGVPEDSQGSENSGEAEPVEPAADEDQAEFEKDDS